MLTKTNFTQY